MGELPRHGLGTKEKVNTKSIINTKEKVEAVETFFKINSKLFRPVFQQKFYQLNIFVLLFQDLFLNNAIAMNYHKA